MLTDKQAAQLILQLITRIQFQGSELEAVVALKNWADRTSSGDEPSLGDEPSPCDKQASEAAEAHDNVEQIKGF